MINYATKIPMPKIKIIESKKQQYQNQAWGTQLQLRTNDSADLQHLVILLCLT